MRETKLKYLLHYEGKGNKQSSESESDGLYPFYSCSTKVKYTNNPTFMGIKILISTGGQFYAFLANGKFDVSTDVLIHSVKEEVEAGFLMHFLEAKSNDINDTMFKGMGIKHLDRGLFYDMRLNLPDLTTQQRIAAFLDAETSKVDSLSDELTKFKANLQLQKRSLVSECVTKGIPSERDRAYKDSGVEWLGEIPAGWELSKIKSAFEQRNEKVSDKDFAALSVTKNGVVPQLENVAKTDNGDSRKLVLKGDFVINSRSDRKSSSGVSPLDGSVSLINIVMHNRYDNVWMPFAHHMFKSHMFCEEFYARGNGMVADLWSTNWNKMRFIDIAVPPLDEQQRIADYLDVECARIDALIGEIDNQSNLLKTYRKSLINEVVTGKVEV